jgi:hypothetical protein
VEEDVTRGEVESQRREPAGESLWTKTFSPEVRTKLLGILETWLRYIPPGHDYVTPEMIEQEARKRERMAQDKARWAQEVNLVLKLERGIELSSGTLTPDELLERFRNATDEVIPAILEASIGIANRANTPGVGQRVKQVLETERIAYRLIDAQLVPFDSSQLQQSVVEPALRLLAGRRDLDEIERLYQDALREVGSNPVSAITTAARALQGILTTIGYQGTSLSDQLRHAVGRGALVRHSAKFGDAIDAIAHWVNADRSETVDAPNLAKATTEDAWFVVHVVGALIVRLAEGPRV